jgi:hypothetical protein
VTKRTLGDTSFRAAARKGAARLGASSTGARSRCGRDATFVHVVDLGLQAVNLAVNARVVLQR